MLKDVALIHNNAKVGSQIACALSKLRHDNNRKQPTYHHVRNPPESPSDIVSILTNVSDKLIRRHICEYTKGIWNNNDHARGIAFVAVFSQVVIGGINVDFIAKGKTEKLVVSLLCSKTASISPIILKATQCCSFWETVLSVFSLDRQTQGASVSRLAA